MDDVHVRVPANDVHVRVLTDGELHVSVRYSSGESPQPAPPIGGQYTVKREIVHYGCFPVTVTCIYPEEE